MIFLEIKNETEFARWHLIFTILSMKKIEQFWINMNLDIEPKDYLSETAQTFVHQYRSIEADVSLSSKERLIEYQHILQKAFDKIVDSYGINISQIIYNWGIKIFRYEMDEDAEAFIWRFLFRRLAGIGGLSHILIPLQVSATKLEAIKASVIKHLSVSPDLCHRLETAKKEPLSDWEKYIYNTYANDASPIDWVENTIGFVNIKMILRDLKHILSNEDLKILEEWGERQADEMQMPRNLAKLPQFEDL